MGETKQIWVNKDTNLEAQVLILVAQNALKYTFQGSPNYSLTLEGSLRCRHNLTLVSNICETVPISLLWVPCGLNKLLEACFELPFNVTGKMTMTFLTGQSWCMLKSRDTVGGPERGFQSCFVGRHNPKLSSICGTGHPRRNPDSTSGGGGQFPPFIPIQTRECLSFISIAINDFSILFKFSGEH